MDWRAVDKVAAWRVFKKKMTIIFIADGIPMEQQYAKVLVAGGNEAFNRWDAIEPLMKADEQGPCQRHRMPSGTTSREASNRLPHIGITETSIFLISDKSQTKQQLT